MAAGALPRAEGHRPGYAGSAPPTSGEYECGRVLGSEGRPPASSGGSGGGPAQPEALPSPEPPPGYAGVQLPIGRRYDGAPPQIMAKAREITYGAPSGPAASGADDAMVVGYMPVRYSEKYGYWMDERAGLGNLDVRVKKYRGGQGSGSAARHRFLWKLFIV